MVLKSIFALVVLALAVSVLVGYGALAQGTPDETELSPTPESFPAGGEAQTFVVNTDYDEVRIRANSSSDGSGRVAYGDNPCSPDVWSTRRQNGESITLHGCEAGTTKISMFPRGSGELLAS